MEGQGTMKMNRNVIIPQLTVGGEEKSSEGDEEDRGITPSASTRSDVAKNDWMIPLQFQSDIGHIHQKAGFTQIGL